MTPDFAAFDDLVRVRTREYVDELKALIRQPSVSAQNVGIEETAALVVERARRAGVDASIERVSGGPPTIIGGRSSTRSWPAPGRWRRSATPSASR